MQSADFADWSGDAATRSAAEAKLREQELREIADIVNRLDFQEREKNRRNRSLDTSAAILPG